MKKLVAVLVLLLPVVYLTAADEHGKEGGPQLAVAVVHGASHSHVHGVVHFRQMGDEIEIEGTVEGLTPGEHAMHIHEFGDCSSPDAMSAGGHFNPEHEKHGAEDAEHRHVGDLGNITADDSGKATIHKTDKVISLHGPHSIIGRSLIIHEKVDDYSQPTGNAGGRVGCGVVGIANPKPPAPK